MSATDRLRQLLDERGVEWKCYGYENHTWWGDWHAENRPSVNGLFVKVEGVVTPEQAVEATIGRGTCEVKLGSGQTAGWWVCQSCGDLFDSRSALACKHDKKPNFCPNCGKEIVE